MEVAEDSLRSEALDEDVHHAATDLIVAIERIREIDSDESRAAVLVRFHRGDDDLGLAAAATYRAAGRAVGADKHPGPGAPGRRSTGRRDSRDDSRRSRLKRDLKLAEDFVHAGQYYGMLSGVSNLDRNILACSKCPNSLVDYDWLPISYFGDIQQANAWTVSINPSAREFTDAKGEVLTGTAQRFARLADFSGVVARGDIRQSETASALAMQDSVLRRAPYRPYFSKLGNFLGLAVGQVSIRDGLDPFVRGIEKRKQRMLFCHLDLVKCATREPWSKLDRGKRRLLIDNCQGFLAQQFDRTARVRLLLINGRTALTEIEPVLRDFGLRTTSIPVELATTRCELISGTIDRPPRFIRVVGWTANVVNQQLRTTDIILLAKAVHQAIS